VSQSRLILYLALASDQLEKAVTQGHEYKVSVISKKSQVEPAWYQRVIVVDPSILERL
jgi:hypothetical protein